MNFLRNTFSSFPYYKDSDPVFVTPFWNVYNGSSKKDSKITCCIFEPNPTQLQNNKQFYKNCVTSAKTLRFPGLVKVLEVFDDPSYCIVTERVTSFSADDLNNANAVALGVYQLSELFKNLQDNNIQFGPINIDNIYLNPKGEWCLFQFPDLYSQGNTTTVQQFIHFVKNQQYNVLLNLPNTTLMKLTSLQAHLINNYKIVQIYNVLKYEYPFLTHFNDSVDCLIEVSKLLLPLNRSKENALEGLPIQFTSSFLFPIYLPYLTMQNDKSDNKLSEEANILFLMVLLYNCKYLDISYFEDAILAQFDKNSKQVTFLLLKFHKKYVPITTDIPANYSRFYNNLYPRLVACLKDQDSEIKFEALKVFSHGYLETMDLRKINNDFLRHLADVQNFDKDPLVKILVLKILCTQISEKLIGYHGENKGLLILSAALCKHLNPKESFKVKKCVLDLLLEKIDQSNWPMDVLITKLVPGVAPCMMDKNAHIRKQANHVFNRICSEIKEQASLKEQENESGDEDDEEYGEGLDEEDLTKYDIQIDDATLISEMLSETGISPEVDLSSFHNIHTHSQIPEHANHRPVLGSVSSVAQKSVTNLPTPDESLWENNDTEDPQEVGGWDSWADTPSASTKVNSVPKKTKPVKSSSWLDEVDNDLEDSEDTEDTWNVPNVQKTVPRKNVVKKSSWLDGERAEDSFKKPVSRLSTRTTTSRASRIQNKTATKTPTTVSKKTTSQPASNFAELDEDTDDWGNDDW